MLSIPHLIVIFVVALVVFGPEKLPELARTLGKLMADFRRASNDLRSTFDEHMRQLEREAQAKQAALAPPGAVPASNSASSALGLPSMPETPPEKPTDGESRPA